MNNRIKELASQCWDQRLDGMHFDQEKFAELIVRECISICNRRSEVLQKYLDEDGRNMNESPRFFTEGAISGSLRNAQSIRQHFGVEE